MQIEFEALRNTWSDRPQFEKGTMMGFPCMRRSGHFFASLEKDTGNLILKLPKAQVDEMVAEGTGLAFAPNGRTFKEWVAIPAEDFERWEPLLEQAWAFAGTFAPKVKKPAKPKSRKKAR